VVGMVDIVAVANVVALSVSVGWDQSGCCPSRGVIGVFVVTLPSAVDSADFVVTRSSNYRRYALEYKRRIIAEYDLLPVGDGSRGSLLRREGLRRNQIAEWRKTREILDADGSGIEVSMKRKWSSDRP
jgi:hypothetical protein